MGLRDVLFGRKKLKDPARERLFALAEANRQPEAVALCKEQVLPAYLKYKQAGDRLLAYEIESGKDRGRTIMIICTATQFIVAGVGIFIFIVGFLIGVSR